MLVKIEFNDGSETITRHFTTSYEAYDFFNRMCKIHRTVTVSVSDRLLYARCMSRELKGLSDVLR